MFKSPKAPHVQKLPTISAPRTPAVPSEHIAKQFQAVHPDNTADTGLTDMYEVNRHTDYTNKDFLTTL